MLIKYLPLFLLFILLLVIIYSFIFFEKTVSFDSIPSVKLSYNPVCNGSDRSPCVDSLGCSGERICVRGAWTGCINKKVCNPGERSNCIENFCSTGYKICNECGTGYSECIHPKIIQNKNETNNSPSLTVNLIVEQKIVNSSENKSEEKQILDFFKWVESHNIRLVGVNKSTDYFYYNGSKSDDFLDAKNVPNILEVAKGLYKIPDDILKAMNGKTVYLSYQHGRGYTVLSSFPEQHILVNMGRGSIIEQPLTEVQVIHEFGHILDYHGIRGIYNDKENHWADLDNERAIIFNVTFPYNPRALAPPRGYIDVYSTANDAENFAQHFMFYILKGQDFREFAKNDALLKEKYDFFKNKLFHGREY